MKRYFNLFLIHKRTDMILFENFNTNLFDKTFFNTVYEAKFIFNKNKIDYNILFNFLEYHSLIHTKLYRVIKHYILLPKFKKKFFHYFKFYISPVDYSKFNHIFCYFLNHFLNSFLFTFVIFPLYFNIKK